MGTRHVRLDSAAVVRGFADDLILRGCRYAKVNAPERRRLAACILEPVLQGANGMNLVDPLFQVGALQHTRTALAT